MKPLAVCLLLCLLHGSPAPAAAQSAAMPGWVVPVLRLVSATHVEPTTGVVLSADGLVLVPVDFAAPEGELAWAAVSAIAGGTVCLFRAVDGMITRHDCVLPIRG